VQHGIVFRTVVRLPAQHHRIPTDTSEFKGNPETIFEHYKDACTRGLETFYKKHWPCEQRSNSGVRCVNLASGHTKGHQNPDGKVFKTTGYVSAFSIDAEEEKKRFLDGVHGNLKRLVDMKNKQSDVYESEEEYVSAVHVEYTLRKYTHIWGSPTSPEPLVSHKTCFCCLNSLPIHTLFCGHIICQMCFLAYSIESESGLRRVMSVCPLCSNVWERWSDPWSIAIKPATAGLRILSLDGYSPSASDVRIES